MSNTPREVEKSNFPKLDDLVNDACEMFMEGTGPSTPNCERNNGGHTTFEASRVNDMGILPYADGPLHKQFEVMVSLIEQLNDILRANSVAPFIANISKVIGKEIEYRKTNGLKNKECSLSTMASGQDRSELNARARHGETVITGGIGGKSFEDQEHLAHASLSHQITISRPSKTSQDTV
ncbi:hypothetical protein LguiA_026404 [Lonicera macranthoides]